MKPRIGIVGIVVENIECAERVNAVLHEFAQLIVGRMGIPYRERHVSVIALIVDGTNDEVSALTGQLGRIKGLTVKSMVTKAPELERAAEGQNALCTIQNLQTRTNS
jgi:putative iron-only hydrogenase system regulator